MKLVEPKLFLRTFWWSIILFAILSIITDGYVGLKQGFDWSFLSGPKPYIQFVFSILLWTAFSYFIFWRWNLVFRDKMMEKFEKKS
jgi:hypothetical protein